MNFLEAKQVCKKHPYNNPQQGVCSSCLAEKLSNLSSAPSHCTYHYPNTYYSLSNSTKTKHDDDDDRHHDSHNSSGGGHARHGSDSIGGHVADNINGLKKSRSMIADKKFGSAAAAKDAVMKKKGGFLAKLMRSNTSKTTSSKDAAMINTSTTDHHSRSTTNSFVPTKV